MKVGIIGTGYVGLIIGASLASSGNHVVSHDIDEDKVAALSRGEVQLYEPGLQRLVDAQLKAGRLIFTTQVHEAVEHGEVIFVTVATPTGGDGMADLTQVHNAAQMIGQHINAFKVVVIKSTVPVGTTDQVESIIASLTTEEFCVAANPEFIRDGSAIADFHNPRRIIIGTHDPRARESLARLYQSFIGDQQQVLWMSPRSAELTKYATNAMLALRISFMNELAALSEATGGDIEEVRLGLGSDPRIGRSFLQPGIGYGGPSMPKDIAALIGLGHQYNTDVPILEAAEAINRMQPERMMWKIDDFFDGQIQGRPLAIWGVSYKPKTDVIEESPACALIETLLERGASLRVYDPAARARVEAHFGERVACVDDGYSALESADALIVFTDWLEFRSPDFQRIRELLAQPVIFDGRNLYDPRVLSEAGLFHYAFGRRDPDITDVILHRAAHDPSKT